MIEAVLVGVAGFVVYVLGYTRGYKHGHGLGRVDAMLDDIRERRLRTEVQEENTP